MGSSTMVFHYNTITQAVPYKSEPINILSIFLNLTLCRYDLELKHLCWFFCSRHVYG